MVTAVCDPPEPQATANRTLRCLFDFTDDTYRLLGDSLECAGACLVVDGGAVQINALAYPIYKIHNAFFFYIIGGIHKKFKSKTMQRFKSKHRLRQ